MRILSALILMLSTFVIHAQDTLVNDTIKIIRTLKNDVLDGYYAEIDIFGDEVLKRGNYKKGKKDGEWMEINYDSEFQILSNYKAGLRHGEFKVYDVYSEELLVEGNYKGGKRHGKWQTYSEFDMVIFRTKFDFDYDEKQYLRETINYKNGVAQGDSYLEIANSWELGEHKYIIYTGNYLNGKRHGEWEVLDVIAENGENMIIGDRIVSCYFENGERMEPWVIHQGIGYKGLVLHDLSFLNDTKIKIAFDDGSYEIGYVLNGYKHGKWESWSNSNQLTKETYYRNGKETTAKNVEYAVAKLILDDLNIDHIKYMDVNEDRQWLLLATTNYALDIKYWIYDMETKKLLNSASLKKPAMGISGIGFYNDFIAIENFIDEQFIIIDPETNRVVETIAYGQKRQVLNYSTRFNAALKSNEYKSKEDLPISDLSWFEMDEIVHFQNLVSVKSKETASSLQIDLSNGSVQEIKAENFQELQPKNKPGVFYQDMSYAGLYMKTQCKECHDVPNLLFEDVSDYLAEPTFLFIPNKKEKIKFHFATPENASFSRKRDQISSLYFWNNSFDEKYKRTVELNIMANGEYIFQTEDGYYMCSLGMTDYVYYEFDNKLYPLEQFDLKYNRPDIILSRLGYADSSLIKAYHQAYLKRLKKMGFSEDMLKNDFHLPKIQIENMDELPRIDDNGSIELNLKLYDSKYDLDRINVWINDVAIYGKEGISLRDKKTSSYQTNLEIFLAKGNNKIQVSVLNNAGAESYKESFEMECTKGKDKPDLYLVTIGASEYQQSDFNLTYPAKDANDVASIFEKSVVYQNVHIKSLLNEEVNKSNILNLSAFLAEADINDEVIVFIAGHGVLDETLDYYLATYDMDFHNPSENGLAYNDLESLLDGIKPLKKTLIIDACHSGEIDKEEVELADAQVEQGDIQFRVVGKTASPKLGIQNTSELTKSLFADFRKGTGATVISSAGGMEYAMEGDDWNNGLFTYCLISGITSGKADLNNDHQIWLSELQEYLAIEVADLSDGKQQPTSRIANQTINFRIW